MVLVAIPTVHCVYRMRAWRKRFRERPVRIFFHEEHEYCDLRCQLHASSNDVNKLADCHVAWDQKLLLRIMRQRFSSTAYRPLADYGYPAGIFLQNPSSLNKPVFKTIFGAESLRRRDVVYNRTHHVRMLGDVTDRFQHIRHRKQGIIRLHDFLYCT